MDGDRTKILITSIGSRVGLGLLESLRASRAHLTVIGVNSAAEAPQNFSCDRVYLAPATVQKDAFEERLRAIMDTVRPDAVLAGRDEELEALAALAREPSFADVLFLTPGPEAAALCNDKFETWRFAQDHGLPFAESAIDAEGLGRIVARTGYPVIAKQRRGGHASRGVYVVRNDAEAGRVLETGQYVFQAFIEPSSSSMELQRELAFGVPWSFQMRDARIALEGVIDRDGTIVCLAGAVSDTTGGLSLRIEAIEDSAAEDVYRAYARALSVRGHFGPLNLQGKRNANGAFVPYEINGRFTGSVMARVLQGHNHVTQSLDFFLGRQLSASQRSATQTSVAFQIPTYYTVDRAAVSALQAQGHWRADK
jgi:carbamoyl-phosphate synthase large subunit